MTTLGFTLIELLAVIVILAIIALIAVPIVISIIQDSKKSSEEESVKIYIDAVQKAISKKQLEDTTFNPTKCSIQEKGNLLCDNVELNVDMKGITPSYGIIIIQNNKIKYKNVLLKEKYYHKNSSGVITVTAKEIYTDLIEDIEPKGISLGDKYTYQVNSTDTFNFYILSIEDDKVNLIMDRNICNDGTAVTTTSKCPIAWHAGESNNNYGPDTAMMGIYNATKEWTNVPDMIMNYEDENNKNSETLGYTNIITNQDTKVTIITGKPITNTTTVGTTSKPLKARLPKDNEVAPSNNSLCYYVPASCPIWLVEYLADASKEKYILNKKISGIYGYWLLSSNSGNSTNARLAFYTGITVSTGVSNSGQYGIRPVITVSINDLLN